MNTEEHTWMSGTETQQFLVAAHFTVNILLFE